MPETPTRKGPRRTSSPPAAWGKKTRGQPAKSRRMQPRGSRASAATWFVGVGVLTLAAFALFVARDNDEGTRQGPFVGRDLHSLVIDPADSSRVFVGGHDGVAVSTNAGRTWKEVESLSGADAMGWAFSGDRILVGGHRGLYVSEDGGRSFEQRNDGLPATDIHSLGAGSDLIFAASPGAGILVSTDGGVSWQTRSTQAGQSFMGPILVDPKDSEHLIASDMGSGAVESRDGGRTWQALGGAAGAMWISWEPESTDHIVVSGMGGAAESTVGGQTWDVIDVPPGSSVVEMSPHDPQRWYAGVLEGSGAVVWVSSDGGASWDRP